MLEAIAILLSAWLVWVFFQVTLFLLCACVVRPDQPNFNGFRIHVPPSCRELLTERELRAVIEHECGHRRRLHVWENLARLCFLFTRTPARRRVQQELEADDCVKDPAALSMALIKMSSHPFDTHRAVRLSLRAREELLLVEGQPCARDARVTTNRGSTSESKKSAVA